MYFFYDITTWKTMTTKQGVWIKIISKLPCAISIFLQDIYDWSRERVHDTSAWRPRCPLAKCYRPWPLHRTGHTVCKTQPSYHPSAVTQRVHICMFAHTNPQARTVYDMLNHHTHLHPLYREPYVCACVWSYSSILYVWIYNQTCPLLRASSLSCCGNITQMQAEKEKK